MSSITGAGAGERLTADNVNPAKKLSDMDKESLPESSDIEEFYFEKFENRNWTLSLFENWGRWGIRVNPVSFGLSVLVIWGFAIWCMVETDKASEDLTGAQKWVTFTLTWIYMLSQQVWVVFLVILYFSRLGNMKLGKPDDKPEFPTGSWFMMMFSAGIGIGLFFFGVAEPINHYEPCGASPEAGVGSTCYGNRYAQLQDDERAQWAMNITFFHWGIHGWVCYCIVGLLLGAVVYRKNLPMTMKSAFYPLIGDKIFGWMGDILDVISVATTLFGVCTSLGLGVQQLNAGFARMNSDIEVNFDNQAIIIWCITALATISVVTGVKIGIRRLSEFNFLLAQFLLFIALFQEDTWYLLNNLVQSLGFYVQWFIQLGFHSDTFQMSPATTITEDGVSTHITAVAPDGLGSSRTWMNGWTIFYWGWWIAWSPFVGMFIAKISRGRTVREVITGAMTGPAFYAFIWFAVFGGIGLRMERQAANLGIGCGEDDAGEKVFSRILGDGVVENLNEPMVEIDGLEYWRLSCRGTTDMWFDVFANFPMTRFYWGVSLASLILYFVTSSDSGSLVIDCLTANGNPHPPLLQRVFWSCTEGAVAMALLKAGGSKGLSALQSVAIISGVPYTVVTCLMCKGLWDVLAEEYDIQYGIPRHAFNDWQTGLLDVLDFPTFNAQQGVKTIAAVFIPWQFAARAASWAEDAGVVFYQVAYAILFYGWIVLLIANVGQAGLWAIAWTMYLAFTLHMAWQRTVIRNLRNIGGNVFNDILLSMIVYPLVAVQMYDESVAAKEGSKPSESDRVI